MSQSAILAGYRYNVAMTRLFAGTPFDIPPTCEHCGQLQAECTCTAAEKAAIEQQKLREADRLKPDQQTAKVRVEKRKGSRVVTTVDGLAAKANDLPAVLAQLQAACGTGGTVKAKEDRIELQGDHVANVKKVLAEIGYRVSR